MAGEVIQTVFSKGRVLTENSDAAKELYNQNRFGKLLENGKVQMSLVEALYLAEKAKIEILDSRNKKIDLDLFIRKAEKSEHDFWVRYCVFKDIPV